MPQFKVKDLMIQLPDDRSAGQPQPQPCPQPSFCAFPTIQGCPGNTLCLFPTQQGCPNNTLCLIPTVLGCPLHTICLNPTFQCPLNTCACTGLPSICQIGTIPPTGCFGGTCGLSEITDPWTILTTVLTDPVTIRQVRDTELEVLRVQLRQAMANVEEQVKAEDERLSPQSVEDVDILEGRLQEALRELQERKTELQKRSGGSA